MAKRLSRKRAIEAMARVSRLAATGTGWYVECPIHGRITHLTPDEAQRLATEHYDYCVAAVA